MHEGRVDLRPRRDRPDRRAVVAVLGELPPGRIEYRLARVAVACPTARPASSCGDHLNTPFAPRKAPARRSALPGSLALSELSRPAPHPHPPRPRPLPPPPTPPPPPPPPPT